MIFFAVPTICCENIGSNCFRRIVFLLTLNSRWRSLVEPDRLAPAQSPAAFIYQEIYLGKTETLALATAILCSAVPCQAQEVQAVEPVPIAPPPPAPPAPRCEKVTLSATELFAFNSATLTMPQPGLDTIAAALTADPSITDVDIAGYADRLGATSYNLGLSQRRAAAVRGYLVGRGIDGARLKDYGKGESNPVVRCNNKRHADLIRCLEPNRRVQVEQITIERRVQTPAAAAR